MKAEDAYKLTIIDHPDLVAIKSAAARGQFAAILPDDYDEAKLKALGYKVFPGKGMFGPMATWGHAFKKSNQLKSGESE